MGLLMETFSTLIVLEVALGTDSVTYAARHVAGISLAGASYFESRILGGPLARHLDFEAAVVRQPSAGGG